RFVIVHHHRECPMKKTITLDSIARSPNVDPWLAAAVLAFASVTTVACGDDSTDDSDNRKTESEVRSAGPGAKTPSRGDAPASSVPTKGDAPGSSAAEGGGAPANEDAPSAGGSDVASPPCRQLGDAPCADAQ